MLSTADKKLAATRTKRTLVHDFEKQELYQAKLKAAQSEEDSVEDNVHKTQAEQESFGKMAFGAETGANRITDADEDGVKVGNDKLKKINNTHHGSHAEQDTPRKNSLFPNHYKTINTLNL